MVKNTKGGNKGKKVARKNIIGAAAELTVKTRLANPTEPCEVYATVTRLFGQGFCEVLCSDGKYRTCIIRKKFSGRNKRGNVIGVDSKVLVGTRDWEVVKDGKKEKCDLLEVYDTKQHNDIRTDPRSNWKLLISIEEKRIGIHQIGKSRMGGSGSGSGSGGGDGNGIGDDDYDYDDGIDFVDNGPSTAMDTTTVTTTTNDNDNKQDEDDDVYATNIMKKSLDKRYATTATTTTTKSNTSNTTYNNPTFDLEGDINWDDI
jgi:translation initiation factor IF-1